MADLHLRQTIELFVDQQVFMDVVHGNEQVDEFSALTEVTSFEQRGENLYLEGNILFTAYLQQVSSADDGSGAHEGEAQAAVQHITHRMPFDVTVPVDAQIAGMLSVAVTVPDSTVDILGPGWIHIRALVQVEGLSPDGGYTAHCGAQEAVVPAVPGILATEDSAEPAEDHTAWEQYAQEAELQAAQQAEQGEETVVQNEHVWSEQTPDFAKQSSPLVVDDLLQPLGQRADAAPEAPFSPSKHFGQADEKSPMEPESSLSENGWKTQLAGADRALFGGTYHPYRTGRAADEESAQPAPSESPMADEAPTHHFHFESVDLEATAPPVETPNTHVDEVKAEFEAARSEWQDAVLQPAPEPVIPVPLAPPPAQPVLDLNVDVNVQKVTVKHETVDPALVATASTTETQSLKSGEVTMSYTAVPEAQTNEWTAAQWFWNTLNIPAGENTYKMKFRIVQEAETLEDIATHYATSATELLRVNPAAEAGLETGSLLYIPTR
ncbi:MAG: hypothetical protein OWT28_02175 [Firmicutes bacterium]|nr:hypothetical protein [Bacillota bacterium]